MQTQGTTNFLNFSDALNHLRWGERVARRKWRTGQSIRIAYLSHGTRVEYTDEYGDIYDWEPSDRMILAEDWYVLGEHQ